MAEGMGSSSATYEGDDFLGDAPPGDVPTTDGSSGRGAGSAPADSEPPGVGATVTPAGSQPVVARQPSQARPTLVKPTGQPPAGQPQPSPPEDTPPPTAALSPEVAALLQAERLPLLPNESDAAAAARLAAHLQGANRRFYRDFKTQRDAADTALRELQGFKEALTPMLRDFYQRQQTAAREAALAAIPDKELDPQGYDRWLLETNLRETFSMRQEREAAEARAAEEAQQAAQLDADLGVGESIMDELEAAVTSDPAIAEAYEFSTNAMADALMLRNPGMTREQALDVVPTLQAADLRRAREAGVGLGDFLRGNHEIMLRQLAAAGYTVARQQAAAAVPQQPLAGQQPPAARTPAAAGSPTAARIANRQQQAAARAVVSPTPAAVSAPTGLGEFNPLNMSEDDFLDEALSSPARLAEINAAFRQNYAKHSWRGNE